MHSALAPRNYVAVCALLVALTILTVAISFLHVPGAWHVVLGLIIAVCKAALVVLFFMQALQSDRLTWIVIAVACSWFGLMLVLTLTDYFSRGMIPFTPGH